MNAKQNNILEKRFPLWILACGKGSRVGESKGLIEINSKLWIVHLIDKYAELDGSSVFIGLGADSEEYYNAISWLPKPNHQGYYQDLIVHTLINEDWRNGQFSTLSMMSQEFNSSSPVWMLPVDCYLPNKELLVKLEKEKDLHSLVVIPTFEGRRGHPIIIDGSLRQTFQNYDVKNQASRLDYIIRSLNDNKVKLIEVSDPKVLTNLNYPHNWDILKSS